MHTPFYFFPQDSDFTLNNITKLAEHEIEEEVGRMIFSLMCHAEILDRLAAKQKSGGGHTAPVSRTR